MMQFQQEARSILLSVRIYHILLFAYPSAFRQEYSAQMEQVFRDLCLRTYSNNGLLGMLGLWSLTLIDFFSTVIEEHLQRGAFMSRQKFVRLSGFALVLAGLHKIFAFLPDLHFRYAGQASVNYLFPTLPLYVPLAEFFMLMGLFVLLFSFFEHFGRFQRIFIALSVAGASINFISALIHFLPFLIPIVQKREDYYQPLFDSVFYPFLFRVGIYAIYTIYLGLIGFGIVSAVKKTMPISKVLPFFMGVPFLILPLIPITQWLDRETYILINTTATHVIPGLGWVALGIMLIAVPLTSRLDLSRPSLTATTP